MAKKTQAQIEFSASTKEFNDGIKNMNAQLKTFGNELKLNSTQLKGNADDVGLLQDRQKILQSELEASKTKVNLQEQALAKCKEMLGENSTEYRNLTNSLLQAKNQQAAIENEISKTEKALANASQAIAETADETKQAESAFDKLSREIDEQEGELSKLAQEYKSVVLSQGKGSKEAKELEGRINELNGELKENKAEMKKADDAADELTKSLDKLGEEAKDAGDGFTIGKGAIAGFIGNGLSSLTGAIGNGISNIAGLSEETREYRNEMGKLEVAFAEGGYSAETATKTYKDFQAVLGDEGQSVEAVSHLAKLTSSEKELEQWTTICTGVYATFGASLPIEGLTEAANETAKVGQVTGPLADALNWAGVNEDKFNESLAKCSTEQERQQLITSTLNGLYTDAAQKYRDTNKEVIDANRAQSDYTDTMAAFGEKVEPITTTVKEGFNGLLGKVLELVEGADVEGFTAKIESGFAYVSDTILPAVVEGFDKLKTAWQWLSEHTGVLTAVATVIGVITTAITAYNVVQGIKTAMDAANVTTVWALVSAHVAQAAAAMAAIAPYVLIVAAIAAVIAVIVLCVKHWDTIKAKITEVAQKVKDKVIEIKDNITNKLNEAKQKAVDIFNNIRTAITEKITALREKISSTFNSIKEKIMTPINNARTAVSSAIENLRSGFVNKVNSLRDKVSSVFNSLKEKITSPVQKARDTIKGIVDKIKNIFNFKWSLPKLKIPHISVTGGKAPFGIGGQGSLPKFSIKWNAKGGLFTQPTVFAQGFGEAGHEYAIPLNERSVEPLAAMINKLSAQYGGNGLSEAIASRFDMAVDKLADRLERLEMAVNIDGERVATATASYSDAVGGTRYELINRGLAIE